MVSPQVITTRDRGGGGEGAMRDAELKVQWDSCAFATCVYAQTPLDHSLFCFSCYNMIRGSNLDEKEQKGLFCFSEDGGSLPTQPDDIPDLVVRTHLTLPSLPESQSCLGPVGCRGRRTQLLGSAPFI